MQASGALSNSEELLLDGHRGAGFLQRSRSLVGSFLRHALEDGLGGTVDDGLGLAEAERGELADDLDDLDLLLAGCLEHDVERGLLLDLFGRGATRGCASGGHGDGGSSGDLEGLLELLDAVGQLDERELLERVEQLLSGELCHDVSPCLGFSSPGLNQAADSCFSRSASTVRTAFDSGAVNR